MRLPNSVFQPYASVATNLLFFTKGEPTKEIWYWEHMLPEGYKSYSKTKPIQKTEFVSLLAWWNKRSECKQAWRVPIEKIAEGGWNLDSDGNAVCRLFRRFFFYRLYSAIRPLDSLWHIFGNRVEYDFFEG